jgi:hypothetical protein
MEGLLTKVIDAHGGLKRWNELNKVQVTIIAGGKLLEIQGSKLSPAPREMTVWLHEQHASVNPYRVQGHLSDVKPNRVAIETEAGEVIEERIGTVAELHHHMTLEPTWDPLDHANFNGYAMWNYMVTPFFMTMPGVEAVEIEPWQENPTEQWRVLRIIFPETMAGHSKIQDFYFGEDFLMRRLDYNIDFAGTFDVAHMVHDVVEVQGIKIPTKRRAYKKGPDGRPIMNELMIWIDESNIRYS